MNAACPRLGACLFAALLVVLAGGVQHADAAPDLPPTVTATTPAGGATAVPLNANLTITFSEPVNVLGEWFGIFCGTSRVHTAVVSGGPVTFTLDPLVDFAPNEGCTVTVKATQVTDQDLDDPPDAMEQNYTFSFETAAAPPDLAPSVVATTPANGATGVPVDVNPTIMFSEAVNVAANWFEIVCGTSGAHAATVSGGPVTFTLNPAADFAPNETCVVTVKATQVTDQDLNDPPDAMDADYTFSFQTAVAPDDEDDDDEVGDHDDQDQNDQGDNEDHDGHGDRGHGNGHRVHGGHGDHSNKD